ncbi:hypothetical protein AB0J83_13710 [Actinoplanes sp. NPDC049596]|uniref:hypothetical protein n=1 Tax=unclassified Actinoplanes TaxID=2626549 RepID=UPI00341D8BEA
MRYGTPSRPAHRATADGGLVLLARGIAPAGQHRPAAPRARRRARAEPLRPFQLLTRGLAALILLALLGTFGFLIFADRFRDRPPATTLAPAALAEPRTLALGDVFPAEDGVRPAGADGPYAVDLRHMSGDCAEATTGDLGPLLKQYGCREVVRAGLIAPYEGYRVTAGAFNLADAAGASEVEDLLRGLVESGDGSFATLPSGGPGTAAPQIGWHARGHYLLYCVITRADGQLVPNDDPVATRITAEIIDTHLAGSLLKPVVAG